MAKPELINSISFLSKKIDNLLALLSELQRKNNELEIANEELKKQHQEDLILLEKAEKQIEFLTVSYKLASSPDSIISARTKLSQLIRTIDSCIRMINED